MLKSYGHLNYRGEPLDFLLDEIFESKENGFFIELGANDGLNQSNTALFEFSRGWKGILIEPSVNAFNKCKAVRPNSICLNMACVSDTYVGDSIEGDFNGSMMSSVNGIRRGNAELVRVQVSTLEKILDSHQVKTIDFLSLDTEGYEHDILRGLNLKKYRPKYILIEIYSKQYSELVAFLEENKYILMCNLSGYNHKDNALWDGTHNDYLFIDGD
jgi:FkbM family methyltransferase